MLGSKGILPPDTYGLLRILICGRRICMRINVNGTSLFYETTGTGTSLLLLHGNGEDHHIFDPLADKLKERFTIFSIDSRNHGQSGKTDDYSYETMAEDIFAFTQSLALGPVNIIGFSDGAIVSLLMALRHRGCISKMALLGINLSPEDFTEESYQFVKQHYERTNDPLFRLMLEEPNISLEDVKEVGIPVLVAAGENDIFKPETFSQMVQVMPDASLVIMEGHTHDSYICGQDLLYPELLRFFSGKSAGFL